MPSFRDTALIEMGIGRGWMQRPGLAIAQATLAEGAPSAVDSLALLSAQISDCQRCDRAKTRTRAMPGSGSQEAQVMVVGLVPTPEDAAAGGLISGAPGRLFDQMLYAVGLGRENVYLASALRCDGGAVSDIQRDACAPYLAREIDLLKPDVIVLIAPYGAFGPVTMPPQATAIPQVELPHPAQLLAEPKHKRLAWMQLLELRKLLGTARRN